MFGDNVIALYIGTILSSILLALNAYTKDYDLGEIDQNHTNAVNELWDIRETYLSLLTDINTNSRTINQITTLKDDRQALLLNVYSGSQRTNSRTYKEASKALQQNEELAFINKGIDAFCQKN